MDTHKFRDKYPIFILAFLTQYVGETDQLSMAKEQAYVLLPQFLNDLSAAQFPAVHAGSRYSGVFDGPKSYKTYSKATPRQTIYTIHAHLFRLSISEQRIWSLNSLLIVTKPYIVAVTYVMKFTR